MTIPKTPDDGKQPAGVRDVEVLLERLDERLAVLAGDEAPPDIEGYRADAKGRLTRESCIRASEQVEDQTVRRILAYGVDLADQIARFRAHTTSDLIALLDVLAEQYGKPGRRGRKGNWSAVSFDGRLRVVIQVADRIVFGPELQVARRLIDECIAEWTAGARDEVVALVQHAFEPDKQGRLNREAVLRLRRYEIDDERWRRAQLAIADSIRVVGSRRYLRLYMRGTPDAAWIPVPIDIASTWTDPGYAAEDVHD